MTRLGYTLSSEEFDAPSLVALAERAEQAGFAFASISDHFHPWVDAQGESPFVWGTLGAISQRTERIELITGVTCPTARIHPAIVAQAAATAASLLPDRFSFGVGTGENLNEHVVGARWPGVVERQDRLGEAIEVIRELWEGKLTSHRGRHFTVENARLYSLPEKLPPGKARSSSPRGWATAWSGPRRWRSRCGSSAPKGARASPPTASSTSAGPRTSKRRRSWR